MPRLMPRRAARLCAALFVPLLLAASSGCDVITADLRHSEKTEWRRTYDVAPGARVEIRNVNGGINVEPSTGSTVEVVAVKTARGATPEAAKQALERAEIREEASREVVSVATKVAQTGWLRGSSIQVEYTVKVPASVAASFSTVNGRVDLNGLAGRVTAETTNGGVVARNISGPIEASTTNGGVDVEVSQVADNGIRLGCTNGGVKLRLPQDAKATISASVTNGGIEADGLKLETTQNTRRRLEGRLNGGGPTIRLEGTNGGIQISAR